MPAGVQGESSQPPLSEGITAVRVRLTIAATVWFWCAVRPQRQAKAIDSLETHIHPTAFDLELAAAIAESEIGSSANIPGDAVRLVVLHHVQVQPAGQSAFGYVLALCIDLSTWAQQFAQMLERFSALGFSRFHGFGLVVVCVCPVKGNASAGN